MQIKVRIFIDNKQVKPSEVRNLTIKNATVDRIINDVVERNCPTESKRIAKAS